ncbi:oligosaccharide flippase family protein, partial [Eisenbergiella porci]
MRIKKNTLITGTIILTVTGLASRLIGFFYRIFLSRLFGEENMGIYQLIGPVMALVFSLSAAGLQNAISKFVAGET